MHAETIQDLDALCQNGKHNIHPNPFLQTFWAVACVLSVTEWFSYEYEYYTYNEWLVIFNPELGQNKQTQLLGYKINILTCFKGWVHIQYIINETVEGWMVF